VTPAIVSFGICRAKAGHEEELGRRMAELVLPTRAEQGCLRYELYRDLHDPAVWIFCEAWTTGAALDAHAASAHLKAFLASTEAIRDGLPNSFATMRVR